MPLGEIALEVVMPACGVVIPRTAAEFADSPAIAAWARKAQAGVPVTQSERNTLIAYLAWSRDQVASPPLPGTYAGSAVLDINDTLLGVLGARAFEGGDVVIDQYLPSGSLPLAPTPPPHPAVPPAPAPQPAAVPQSTGGASVPTRPVPAPAPAPVATPQPAPSVLRPVAMQPTLQPVPFVQPAPAPSQPPAPLQTATLPTMAALPHDPAPRTLVIREADRRRAYDDLTAALFALELRPEQIVAADGSTADAGWIVVAGFVAAVALVGGLGAYAIYSARQSTADVTRIREDAQTARVVEQIKGQNKDYVAFLDCQRTGASCTPSPLMRQAVEVRPAPLPDPEAWKSQLAASVGTSVAWGVGGLAGFVGLLAAVKMLAPLATQRAAAATA